MESKLSDKPPKIRVKLADKAKQKQVINCCRLVEFSNKASRLPIDSSNAFFVEFVNVPLVDRMSAQRHWHYFTLYEFLNLY